MIVRQMLAAGYMLWSAWCFSRRAGMIDEYITEREEYLELGSGPFSYLNIDSEQVGQKNDKIEW